MHREPQHGIDTGWMQRCMQAEACRQLQVLKYNETEERVAGC